MDLNFGVEEVSDVLSKVRRVRTSRELLPVKVGWLLPPCSKLTDNHHS